MKKKEIIILLISFATIVATVMVMLQILSPKQNTTPTSSEAEAIPTIPNSIDETVYKDIENLSDYGEATLTGIGKKDLFSSF